MVCNVWGKGWRIQAGIARGLQYVNFENFERSIFFQLTRSSMFCLSFFLLALLFFFLLRCFLVLSLVAPAKAALESHHSVLFSLVVILLAFAIILLQHMSLWRIEILNLTGGS